MLPTSVGKLYIGMSGFGLARAPVLSQGLLRPQHCTAYRRLLHTAHGVRNLRPKLHVRTHDRFELQKRSVARPCSTSMPYTAIKTFTVARQDAVGFGFMQQTL